jgi:hypothetical protein
MLSNQHLNLLDNIWICWTTSEFVGQHLNLLLKNIWICCWKTSEFVGQHLNLLDNIWICWTTSEFVEQHLTLLGNIWICWKTSEFVGQHLNLLNNIWISWATSEFVRQHLTLLETWILVRWYNVRWPLNWAYKILDDTSGKGSPKSQLKGQWHEIFDLLFF